MQYNMSIRKIISIHAPPRGATGYVIPVVTSTIISIHAPPRGATRPPRISTHIPGYFNSRPSARGDSAGWSTNGSLCLFQFTPLREGRHGSATVRRQAVGYFNSRPSARGD